MREVRSLTRVELGNHTLENGPHNTLSRLNWPRFLQSFLKVQDKTMKIFLFFFILINTSFGLFFKLPDLSWAKVRIKDYLKILFLHSVKVHKTFFNDGSAILQTLIDK